MATPSDPKLYAHVANSTARLCTFLCRMITHVSKTATLASFLKKKSWEVPTAGASVSDGIAETEQQTPKPKEY